MGLRPSEADLERLRARDISIELDPQQDVSIDGEVVARTPIQASIAREALRVVVPLEEISLS